LQSFFGWLGIHKFILGYTTPGAIMLAVSLLAWCVGGTFVMYIIGIVEGIIYLTKSDQEFRETYIDGTREWF
jgi:TM2 domain-containing membrane protein YozV